MLQHSKSTDPEIKNIIEHSEIKSESGLVEWYFANYVVDTGEANSTCGICKKSNVRYKYLIKNSFNSNYMYVGSDCLLNSGIPIIVNGQRIEPYNITKHFNRLESIATHKRCIQLLTTLSNKDGNQILVGALKYYQKNGYLTPKFAFVVLWHLEKNNISFNPRFFKVTIKRNRYKEDYWGMSDSKRKIVDQALNKQQIKSLRRFFSAN